MIDDRLITYKKKVCRNIFFFFAKTKLKRAEVTVIIKES